jgi:hypothetical protein
MVGLATTGCTYRLGQLRTFCLERQIKVCVIPSRKWLPTAPRVDFSLQ